MKLLVFSGKGRIHKPTVLLEKQRIIWESFAYGLLKKWCFFKKKNKQISRWNCLVIDFKNYKSNHSFQKELNSMIDKKLAQRMLRNRVYRAYLYFGETERETILPAEFFKNTV